MKSRFKRYMTFVLSLAMLVGMLPQAFVHAEEVAPDVSTNQKGQVAFTASEGGQLRVWTDEGTEYMISEENNNVLLEYEVGEEVHTEVKENSGYEVATYTVTTDSGTEKDLLSEKSTDIVITEEMQNVAVVFNKKEVKSDNMDETKKDTTVKNDVTEKDDSVSKELPAQQNTVSNTVSSVMRSANGISTQAVEDESTPTVPTNPTITVHVYNLNGTEWKSFTYSVPYGTNFSVNSELESTTESVCADLISAIEGDTPFLSLGSDADYFTNLLTEAENEGRDSKYYNHDTSLELTSDFNVNSSMELDFKFEQAPTVDLVIHYNNGVSPSKIPIPYGTSPSAHQPADPVKADAEFEEWFIQSTGKVFNWSDKLYTDVTIEAVYSNDSVLDEVQAIDPDDIPDKITNVKLRLGQFKNTPKNQVGSHTKWRVTIEEINGTAENKKWARLLGLQGKTFWGYCVSPGLSRGSYGTNSNATLYIDNVEVLESGIITFCIRPTEAKGWSRGRGIGFSKQDQKVYFYARMQNVLLGKFKLKKLTTLPNIVDSNPNYSVAGAEYTIYRGELKNGVNVSGKKTYGKLVTKTDGTTDATKALAPGHYTVVETTPSKGHSKFPEVEGSCLVDSKGRRMYNNIIVVPTIPDSEGNINNKKIPVYEVLNSPQMDPWLLAIQKFNKESGLMVNAGNAHFDVEYKFSYYVTKNMTEAQCKATQPNRVWYMKPNPIDGKLIFDADHLVRSKSDPLYYNESGEAAIPIGTITVQEVSDKGTGYLVGNTVFKPAPGAVISGNFVLYHINDNMGFGAELNVLHTTDNHNDIRRGDLKFVKVDSETMDRLANVPFKITSETTGESHTIVTDINGQASTEASWATRDDSVNLGQSYDDGVFFTGYGPKSDEVISEEDKANGVTWETAYNNVMKTYPNAAAKDKVGALPYDRYRVEEQRCTANEGKDLLNFVVNVAEQHNNVTIDMGTLDNHQELSIYTIAKDALSLTKEANASGEVKLIDEVHYACSGNAKGKTYITVATLMDKETGKPCLNGNGEPITAEKEFTPKASIGQVDVPIVFNGADVIKTENGEQKPKDVVVFERLYEKGADTTNDSNIVTKHEDIEDEGQTVTLEGTEVKTTAMGKDSGMDEVDAKKEAVIVDIVSCSGLTKGREYRLNGILMDKETGEPLIANDKQVTATKTFTATDSYMEVEMEFKFDASALAGKTTVVFEDLYQGEKKIAVHADLEDIPQTVHIVEIKTSASIVVQGDADGYVEKLNPSKDDSEEGTPSEGETEGNKTEESKPEEDKKEDDSTPETGKDEDGNLIVRFKEGQTSEKTTLIDIVSYKGLTPGREYDLEGTIYDKSTKDLLKVAGATVNGATKFTPTEPDGEVEMAFVFDSRGLEGKDIVVFEYLKCNGNPVASHEDPEDEDQTIHFVEIETTAMGKDTESDETQASEVTTIIDAVKLTNLTVGNKYKLVGHLMNATTGENIIVDGKEVVAEKEFTADEKNMTVELEYTFNSKALAGVTTVVFEDLYKDDILVATHSDLTDEGQQVDIVDIGTRASDKESGGKEMTLGKDVTLLDIVDFTNLKPDEEYTIKGVIYDKETGKELIVNGKKVTAKVKFKPVDKNGTVDVEFNIDTKAIQGKDIVVFESLFDKRGKKIATHEDINDEGQTVHVPKAPKGKGGGPGKLVQTGESVVSLVFALACIAMAVYMAVAIKRRKSIK